MEYKNFLEDFITRTQVNLEEYHGDYEVTQLVNSLLGLVSIPESWEYGSLDNYEVDFKRYLNKENNKIFFRIDEERSESDYELINYLKEKEYEICFVTDYIDSEMKFKDFIRHFRNGVAHGYVYPSNLYGKVETVFFADYNPSKHKGKYLDMKVREKKEILDDFDYVFEFSVGDLEDFVTKFSQQILKKLGIKDDGED